MGFRPQKHNFSVIGVKYPLFNLKGPFLLSQVILNLITNPFSNKKVYAPLEEMGIWPPKHVFWVEHPFFHLKGPVPVAGMMTNQFLGSIQKEKMAMFHQKMAIWPLEHPKNALFSRIAPKQIYFWPYSVKGSYLEYKKPHVEDGHWPLAWRQKWRVVPL